MLVLLVTILLDLLSCNVVYKMLSIVIPYSDLVMAQVLVLEISGDLQMRHSMGLSRTKGSLKLFLR